MTYKDWHNSAAVTIEKWDKLLKELANYTYQTYIGATTDYYTEIADDDIEDTKKHLINKLEGVK